MGNFEIKKGDIVKGTIPGWIGGGDFVGLVVSIVGTKDIYTVKFIKKPKNYANAKGLVNKSDINCIMNRKEYEREYDELG
jgi:hypothetical protein